VDGGGRHWQALNRQCLLILPLVLLGLSPSSPAHALDPKRPVKSLLEMRQDRVTIQQWDLSCGAAALGTVLNHQYNDPVSERDIAKGLIGRDKYIDNPALIWMQEGFSLLDLKRYVDRRGYAGIGYGQLDLDNLTELAPIIVPIEVNGYNHFVVFRGIWGNRVLVADPAWGNRTMTVDEFEDAWLPYPEFGRVGFVVARADGTLPPNRLAPRAQDFAILR
jgi:predicted double-glycine peptidase